MCYHVGSPSKSELKNKLPKKKVYYPNENEIFHISGFTRPYLPVTLNQDSDAVIEARWKLIPSWVKTETDAGKYANTLNAEAESIFEKASYKNYIQNNRGLLYVTGFYEPHKVAGKKDTENYFIYALKHEIISLGIVYSNFTDQETGETYPTFSVITTAANELLEEVHNEKKRMPLVIPEESRDAWLFAEGKEEIKQLMIPYPKELNAHQVHRVTADRSGNTNRPDIQKPWSGQISLF
ncbi:SOS response-associated peptidase [Sphingobacterium mizutaii]|uniref:SOS response-associated peptidase n=1 Tax=Sphingobacterium mizutaii TaxID=1010 RepID=UPI001627CD56|nr:SOS response-associated peptidase family protein [Sphingobacterium mizutaii]